MPELAADRRRRKKAVEQHIAEHGHVCPGHRRVPHEALDLTADHLVPIAAGGLGGPLRVLCKSCNSSRGRGPVAEAVEPLPPASEWPNPLQR